MHSSSVMDASSPGALALAAYYLSQPTISRNLPSLAACPSHLLSPTCAPFLPPSPFPLCPLTALLPALLPAPPRAQPNTGVCSALSIPTWAIHFSSVFEWIFAMRLVWDYAEVPHTSRFAKPET